MSRAVRPITPHRSGWCLKLPISEYNVGEHDKCPKNFPSSTCECSCDHKGERSLESRGMSWNPFVPPKRAIKIEETPQEADDD